MHVGVSTQGGQRLPRRSLQMDGGQVEQTAERCLRNGPAEMPVSGYPATAQLHLNGPDLGRIGDTHGKLVGGLVSTVLGNHLGHRNALVEHISGGTELMILDRQVIVEPG